jgi:hypothetical protein
MEVSEVYLQSDEQNSTYGVRLCLPRALGYIYQLDIPNLELHSTFPPITYHLEESLILSLPDPFCPKLKHTLYTHSIALHQTTHKPPPPDKDITMRLSIMSLLSTALFLSQTSALPLDAVSADDCHQGLYCGSWDGQAALVLTFF